MVDVGRHIVGTDEHAVINKAKAKKERKNERRAGEEKKREREKREGTTVTNDKDVHSVDV